MTAIHNSNGQRIGETRVNEDTEVMEYVRLGVADPDKHHLNSLGAWAVDIAAIQLLERESDSDDNALVVIYVQDGKSGVRRIQARLIDFHKQAHRKNFGHGDQLILADKYWKREDVLQGLLFP